MLAAARQSALHSAAAPEALLEEAASTTAPTTALRSVAAASGAEAGALSGAAAAGGLGASVRCAVAETLGGALGRAEGAGASSAAAVTAPTLAAHPRPRELTITVDPNANHPCPPPLPRSPEIAGGSLAGQSLLAAEESLTTLRGDASNAFQAGLEDVLDVGPPPSLPPSVPRHRSRLTMGLLPPQPLQTNPNLNASSVTEQAKALLPSFQVTSA